MRRQDIQTGVDYAYREGSHGSYKRVRFLTPADKDTLYTTDRWKKDKGFIRDRYAGAPKKSGSYHPATGWLAAQGENLDKASLEEVLTHGKQVDPEGNDIPWGEADYSYILVTSMAYIHGDYDTLVKAEEDAEQLRIQRENERKAKGREAQALWIPIRNLLNDRLGGGGAVLLRGNGFWAESDWNKDGSSAPDSVRLDSAAASKLLSIIHRLEEENEDLRYELSELDDENTRLSNRVHALEP